MNELITLESEIYTKNDILTEMIKNQRKLIPEEKKLYMQDMRRIVKFIPNSIFTDTCCCWQGYITNKNDKKKGTYINFYYKEKKRALHRLLFINFKDELKEDEYIRFKCPNKGTCCSVNCMYKIKINKTLDTNKRTSCDLLIEKRDRSRSFDVLFF